MLCCSSHSWSSLDPECAVELQARISLGEFWLDDKEFVSMFEDVTAGYHVDENGHLKSIYSGISLNMFTLSINKGNICEIVISIAGNMLIHHHQLAGQWIKGYSAGGSRNSNSYCSNPKYWLKVRERGEVLLSLMQHKNRRMDKSVPKVFEDLSINKHQHYHAIALHIWKVFIVVCIKTVM